MDMQLFLTNVLMILITGINCVPLPVPSFMSDWYKIKSQGGNDSEVEIIHDLNVLPYKVVVEVKVSSNGSDYIFHGIGSAFGDDDYWKAYGGVIYLYDENTVIIKVPNANNDHATGVSIFTGNTGWTGPCCMDRSYQNTLVRVKVWSPNDFETPNFIHDWTRISIDDTVTFKEISHNLGDYPDFIVVQVRGFKKYVSEAQGSTSRVNNTRNFTNCGGVIFGFSNESVRIWYPAQSLIPGKPYPLHVGIISLVDGWGLNNWMNSGYTAQGEFRILAWTNIDSISIESRVLQTKELNLDVDLCSSFVTLEVDATDGTNDGLRFYGVGSTINDGEMGSYGGVIYAYSEQRLVYWVPYKNSFGHAINLGGIWGSQRNTQTSDDVKIRARIFNIQRSKTFCPVEELIIEDLRVNRKDTTQYKRSRISVYEERPSAVTIGTVGVVLISLIVSIVIIPDVPYFFKASKRAFILLKGYISRKKNTRINDE